MVQCDMQLSNDCDDQKSISGRYEKIDHSPNSSLSNKSPVSSPTENKSSKKKRKRRTDLDLSDDGYRWHKYGQKTLMDTTFIRGYYRCARKVNGCMAKKMVDYHSSNNSVFKVTYDGQHNHQKLNPSNFRDSILNSSPSSTSSKFFSHSTAISSLTSSDLETIEYDSVDRIAIRRRCGLTKAAHSNLSTDTTLGHATQRLMGLEQTNPPSTVSSQVLSHHALYRANSAPSILNEIADTTSLSPLLRCGSIPDFILGSEFFHAGVMGTFDSNNRCPIVPSASSCSTSDDIKLDLTLGLP